MTGNYNIDHQLLDIPLFQEKLTPTEHQALLITISYIIHWCRNKQVCHFKQGELSRDWRIKKDFFAKSTKLLLKHNYIKMIKSHSQRDQTSAIYGLDRACTPFAQKLGPKKHKAVPQGGLVNNDNNHYRDGFNNPPIIKNETFSNPTKLETKPNPIIEEWNKLQEELKNKKTK